MQYGLDKRTVNSTGIWLNCLAERVMTNSKSSRWGTATGGVPPEINTGTKTNLFTDDLDNWAEYTLSKFPVLYHLQAAGLHKAKDSRLKEGTLPFYAALERSHLEWYVQFFGPQYRTDMDILKQVQ